MPTESYVDVPGSGSVPIDTVDVTANNQTQKRQVVTVGDPTTAGQMASVTPQGQLETQTELVDNTGTPIAKTNPLSVTSPNETGTWGYLAGTYGTVNVPTGAKVLGIAAHSTTGGSMTINGGNSIPIPANVGLDVAPRGNLVAPTLVFTSTDSYFVEYVQ